MLFSLNNATDTSRDMASFLTHSQPVDDTWLLLSKGTFGVGTPGDHTRRRLRRQNETSFLKTADDKSGVIGQEYTGSVEKNESVSFTAAHEIETPRTVENLDQTSSPAELQNAVPPHLPATAMTDSNYTSRAPLSMDKVSQPSVSASKPLAPHLRRKVASSGEKSQKTAFTAGASATRQNGPARISALLTDHVKPDKAGRGGAYGRGARGGGNSFAAARAEIPKVDPNRHKTNWNPRASWDSSSSDSGRASSGWGTRKKKADEKKAKGKTSSPPAADWSGKLAPPPADWDSRPGFRADQSYAKIMDWMGEIENAICAVADTCLPLDDVTGADGTTYVFALSSLEPNSSPQDPLIRQMGEIVPQFWVPIVIGHRAPQTFWNELVATKSPMPDDPKDLEGAKPWWERFVKGQDRCLNFLKDPPTPEIIGIDPDDEDADQKMKRKHDMGSATHAENRRRYELDHQQEKIDKQRRTAEKQCKLADMETTSNTPNNRNRIKPRYKVYVRSARAEDMGIVKDIYNYYVENSTSVPHMERRSKEEMLTQYRAIRHRRMPYLVAYKPGVLIKAPRGKKNQSDHPTRDDFTLPDTIVGYAFAEDYMNSHSMYRFTAKLEFYTRGTEYMNGVASCLLDKIVGLLDCTYQERGGYEVAGDDVGGLDAIRIIKNLVINMSYDKPEKLEWVSRWLAEWMKFRAVGFLENIGTKNGKA